MCVLQCVAMCCGVLQCGAELQCSVGNASQFLLPVITDKCMVVCVCCSVVVCVCCSVLQCLAVWCNVCVVQCVCGAVWCSVV